MNESLMSRYHEARVANAIIEFSEVVAGKLRAFGEWLASPAEARHPVEALLRIADEYDASQPSYAADLRAAAYAYEARRATERA